MFGGTLTSWKVRIRTHTHSGPCATSTLWPVCYKYTLAVCYKPIPAVWHTPRFPPHFSTTFPVSLNVSTCSSSRQCDPPPPHPPKVPFDPPQRPPLTAPPPPPPPPKTPDGTENIFLSPGVILDGSKPIRGGIPLVFPQFGQPDKTVPSHGFVRTATWAVDSLVDTAEASELVLTIGESRNTDTHTLTPRVATGHTNTTCRHLSQ